MAKDFVDKITAAEAEANKLVEEARERSANKRKQVRQDAEKYVDRAYHDAQLERKEILADSEEEYRSIMAKVSRESDNIQGTASDETIEQAATVVAERIVTLLGDF